jgi:energy-coupling factor transporter transmembrane protein EcfT
MSGAYSSFGTLLKIGDGGGTEVFTTIAEVKDISGPKIAMDTTEVTNMSSPTAFKEKVASLLDAGDVTFDVNFMPENATQGYSSGLLRDAVQRNRRNFKLVFTNIGNTTWAFNALVTGFEVTAAVAGVLTASVTLTITTAPTLA